MDSLQDWPEPVVRVQSLSDSGATVIPPRYVKPPSERPVVNGGSGNHDLSIPVVDFNCADNASAVADACKVWGFFQVINHGVSHELMRRAREDWRQFFHLPMEEKQMYANSPKTYEGYGSRLGTQKGAILDWGTTTSSTSFHCVSRVMTSGQLCLHLYGTKKGKQTLRFLSFRSTRKFLFLLIYKYSTEFTRGTVEEYGREVVSFCERVMKVLALGLGVDEGRLQTAFGGKESGVCMRVNFYPKCPQPDLTLGLSSHSDPGGITVLLPDDQVKGLQVRRGNAWVTVKPVPDSFIVNVGDQIQVSELAVARWLSIFISLLFASLMCVSRWWLNKTVGGL